MTTPTGPGITTPAQVPSFLGATRSPAPVGQNLNANPNVFAPAGLGGDRWGANGGDQIAVGGGATDQTGYVKPKAATLADTETATNYIEPSEIPYTGSLLSRESTCAVSAQTPDSSIAGGGTSAG